MKKCIVLVILLLLLAPNTCLAGEVLYDQYKTDLGFTINSYSKNWTGNKLVDVYEELKMNTYGEEIKYLKEINLYSDNPTGGKEEGVYNASYNQLQILGSEKILLSKNNAIDLYNLENKNSVEDFAKTLSHEYGHHFTLYYLINYEDKTFEDWKKSKMFKARGLAENEKVTNDYINGHEWSIIEICAEDYVQLYGSPTARSVHLFNDIKGRYHSGAINTSTSYSYSIFNINPQENNQIPLALELPTVRKYWEEASGITSVAKATAKPNLALVDAKNLGYDKKQYKFKWTKSVDHNNEEAKYYALVATNLEGNQIVPIKTVKQGEPLEAIVGSIRVSEGNNIMFYTDSFVNSPKILKVYAISSSGGIVSSESLKVDFDNPEVTMLKTQTNAMMSYEEQEVNNTQQVTPDTTGNKYIDKVLDKLFLFLDKIMNN